MTLCAIKPYGDYLCHKVSEERGDVVAKALVGQLSTRARTALFGPSNGSSSSGNNGASAPIPSVGDVMRDLIPHRIVFVLHDIAISDTSS